MTTQTQPRTKITLQHSAIPSFLSSRWESQPVRKLIPTLVGFEDLFNMIDKAASGDVNKGENYPPRNVIQYDENNWEVQFAVAGFPKESLSVTVEGNTLIVKGNIESVNTELNQYLLHGISFRNFEHKITFPENATIIPSLQDGLLCIKISKPIHQPSQQVLEIL